MPSAFIQSIRQQVPDDPRSDDELTLMAARIHPELLDALPDFKADYDRIQQSQFVQPGPVENFARSLGRGAAGVIGSIPKNIAIGAKGLADIAENVTGSKLARLGEPETVQEMPTYQLGQAIETAVPAPTPEAAKSFWLGAVPQGIGSSLGFMAGGVGAKLLKIPSTLAVAGLGAMAQGVQGYEDAKQSGANDSTAFKSFLLNAGIGTSEVLPIADLFHRIDQYTGGGFTKTLIHSLKTGVAQSFEEAAQEAAQQVASNFVANGVLDYDKTRSMTEGLAPSAGAGGVSGFVLGTLMSAIGAKVHGVKGKPKAEATTEPTGTPTAPTPLDFTEPPTGGIEDLTPDDKLGIANLMETLRTGTPLNPVQVNLANNIAKGTGEDAQAQHLFQYWFNRNRGQFKESKYQETLKRGLSNAANTGQEQANVQRERVGVNENVAPQAQAGPVQAPVQEAGAENVPGNSLPNGRGIKPETLQALVAIGLPAEEVSALTPEEADALLAEASATTAPTLPQAATPIVPAAVTPSPVAAVEPSVAPVVAQTATVAQPAPAAIVPPVTAPVVAPTISTTETPTKGPTNAQTQEALQGRQNQEVVTPTATAGAATTVPVEQVAAKPVFAPPIKPDEVLNLVDFERIKRTKPGVGQKRGTVPKVFVTSSTDWATEIFGDPGQALSTGKKKTTASDKLVALANPDGQTITIVNAHRTYEGPKKGQQQRVGWVNMPNAKGEFSPVRFETLVKQGFIPIAAMRAKAKVENFYRTMPTTDWLIAQTEGEARVSEKMRGIEPVSESALGGKLPGGGVEGVVGMITSKTPVAPLEKEITLPMTNIEIGNLVGRIGALDLSDPIEAAHQLKQVVSGFLMNHVKLRDKVKSYLKQTNSSLDEFFATILSVYEENKNDSVKIVRDLQTLAGYSTESEATSVQAPAKADEPSPNPAAQATVPAAPIAHTYSGSAALYSNADTVEPKFTRLVDNVTSGPVTLRIVKGLQNEGQFSNGVITLTMVDADSPTVENYGQLLHEVVHQLDLGTDPALRQAVHAAIDGMTNEMLGIENSPDPRVRLNDVARIERQLVTEERMTPGQARVEAPARMVQERLAEWLRSVGLAMPLANDIATRIIRAIKDIFYRVAMSLQKALGRAENPALALGYIRNRFEALISGQALQQNLFQYFIPNQTQDDMVRQHAPASDSGWLPVSVDPVTNRLVYGDTVDMPLTQEYEIRHTYTDPKQTLEQRPYRSVEQFATEKVAIANDGMDVDAKIAAALVGNQFVLDEVGTGDIGKWLTRVLGLPRFVDLRQKYMAWMYPGTTDPVQVDANARIKTQRFNVDKQVELAAGLYHKLQKTVNDLANKLSDRKVQLKKRELARKAFAEHLEATRKDWMSTDGLTREILVGAKALLNTLAKVTGTPWEQSGNAVIQAINELGQGTGVTPTDYQLAIKELIGSKGFMGNMFDLLSALAKEPMVNFKDSVTLVRDALLALNLPKYASLTENSVAGRAKLATVYGYARTHAWMMARLELRQSTDLDTRARISDNLMSMWTSQRAFTNPVNEMNAVDKSATLEERAYRAYVLERQKLKKVDDQISKDRAVVAAGEVAQRIYVEAANEWAGVAGIHDTFTFMEGAMMIDPVKTDAGWDTAKRVELHVDTRNNWPSSPATVKEIQQRQAQFMAEREQMARDGNHAALDGVYQNIKAQNIELGKVQFTPGVFDTIHRQCFYFLKEASEIFRAIGTTSSRLITQFLKVRDVESGRMRKETFSKCLNVERLRNEAIAIIDPKLRARLAFEELFWNPSCRFIGRSVALANEAMDEQDKWDIAFQQLEGWFRQFAPTDPRSAMIKGKEGAMAKAMRKLIDANVVVDAYNNANTTEEVVFQTGKARKRITRGLATFPRMPSRFFDAMRTAMINAGWGAATKPDADPFKLNRFGDIYNGKSERGEPTGPAAARAALQSYFNDDTIWNNFVRELAYNLDGTPFPSLEVITGTSEGVDTTTLMEVNPWNVQAAFNSVEQGDIVGLAEAIVALETMGGQQIAVGGPQANGIYLEKVLQQMANTFRHLNNAYERTHTTESGTWNSIQNMLPGFMTNAITNERWPESWYDYAMFDRHTENRAIEKMAAQNAYGLNHERLAQALITVKNEINEDVRQYNKIVTDLVGMGGEMMPKKQYRDTLLGLIVKAEGAKGRSIDKMEAQRILDRYKRRVSESKMLPEWQDMLVKLHRTIHSPEDAKTGITLVKWFARRMVNSIGSGISNMFDSTGYIREFGLSPSTIKAGLSVPLNASIEFINGMGQTVGMQTLLPFVTQDRQMLNAYGLGDTTRYQNLALELQNASTAPNEEGQLSALNRGIRKVEAVLQKGVNFVGEKAQHVVIRPLAPFDTMTVGFNMANMVGTLRMVRAYVDKAINWMDKTGKDSDFGVGDNEAWTRFDGPKMDASFSKVVGKLYDDYGVEFSDLIKEVRQRKQAGQYAFSKEMTERIAGMSQLEVSLEGGIANAIPGTRTNRFVGMISPLLNWPIKQSMHVSRMGMDSKGQGSRWFKIPQTKQDIMALQRMLAGLAVMAGGGLAIGMLIDWYNEELLGKRRNLRQLALNQSLGENLLAINEQTARIGVLGGLGDLINEVINTGTGEGDNRGISMDSRVVAMSSFISVKRAISNFFHQDMVADYAGVWRPMMMSTVGNGALQYWDIVNNALSLDNMESRVVARTNAQNWLRATGRTIGMEVRKSAAGGFNIPTPTTPWVGQMQLAALGNSPEDFQAAYQRALIAARDADKENPEQYIREAFSSRHPLRRIFNGVVSDTEYQQLLNAMPLSGRRDVEEAIRLFNYYGETINVKPFTGKEEKIVQPKNTMAAFRRSLYGGIRPQSGRFSLANVY